jgi:two-component system, NtrC family, response regulator AtoC
VKPLAELTVYLKEASSTHPLPFGASLRVGRGSRVQIRIDDPSVSREHLQIHVGPTIEVEDLGSSNGTQIIAAGSGASEPRSAGNVLEPGRRYPLKSGDVLRVGSVPCLLHVEEATGRVSRSTVPPSSTGGAVIADPEMRRIYELAARAARSDIGVLIHGETGSGKELLAEAVHHASERNRGPLLKVNCGAIAENLLESELFGHEKGAFTGAHAARAGLFEATAGGTVFMDEMGEMPLSTQVKLLRVLEERQVRRVGASKSIPINVRFLAATNRDLELEVARGRFRQELYYRISGIVLRIPPLRQRQSEIEPLARHFLGLFCMASRIRIPELTAAAVDAMLTYPWPGNVRELRNAMERAPFLSAGGPILPEHLPQLPAADDDFPEERTDVHDARRFWQVPSGAGTPAWGGPTKLGPHPHTPLMPRADTPRTLAAFRPALQVPLASRNAAGIEVSERERVIQALAEADGNQTKAAELLGISRRTLINRLDDFGLPRPRKKSGS